MRTVTAVIAALAARGIRIIVAKASELFEA